MIFNAYHLSKAWLSTAIAAADSDDRPALYRSTLIEEFDYGVRLVATDGYLLLRAWVPFDGHDLEPEPGLDVLPGSVAVCSDRDRRILGLMKYVSGITSGDGGDTGITVDVRIMEGDTVQQGTLEGMAVSQVRMHVSSQYDEAIESPVFEGVFPNWRPLVQGHVWTSTPIFGLSAHTITKIGKLSSVWGKVDIEFQLGGKVGVARVIVNAPDSTVEGLVMPIRLATEVPESAEVAMESEIEQFADALDDWLAQVTKVAEPDPDTDSGSEPDDE